MTPTLTGLGERSHLMSRAINLDTHITDVVNVFEWERIEGAVLCGHSYGGWVISGAVETLRSKVSALVFVDAHVPEDGETGMETSNNRDRIELALKCGCMSIAPPSAAYFKVNKKDREWVDANLTPQPVGVSQQAIRLTGAREAVETKVYVRAKFFKSKPFEAYLAKVIGRGGWQTYELSSGHDVMVDRPKRLVEILLHASRGAHPSTADAT